MFREGRTISTKTRKKTQQLVRGQYGPHNPHPLSTLKTELDWEGKYDEYGNRREVDIAGCAMPLQKIETVASPRSRGDVLLGPDTLHHGQDDS